MVLLGNWQLRPLRGAQRDQRTGSTRPAPRRPVPLDRRAAASRRRRRHAPVRPAVDGRAGPGSRSPAGTTRPTWSWSAAARSTAGRLRDRHPAACSPTARRCWSTGAGCRRPSGGGAYAAADRAADPDAARSRSPARSSSRRAAAGAVDRAEGGSRPGGSRCRGSPRELPYPVLRRVRAARRPGAGRRRGLHGGAADHENDWLNVGYAVQWWLFAVMTLFAFGWPARRRPAGRARRRRDRVGHRRELASSA